MKYIAATIAVLALATNYAAAECNNMCSGHGTCGKNDACTCYRNWRGNDCSERTCQFGVAFVDTAQGDLDHDGTIDLKTAEIVTQWSPVNTGGTFEEYFNFEVAETAHAYMECSNKGLCDRTSGECVCFDGYEGSSCQRTVCHNSCSGNGVCRNIVDMTRALATTSSRHSYQLWDGLKNQACVCDPGYSGIDCRERLCPKGADPLDDGKDNEVQVVSISTDTIGGFFALSYTDLFGEVWKTGNIAATNTDNADDVRTALMSIPNSVIEDCTVTRAAPGTGEGGVYTITFTHNAGDLTVLTVDTSLTTGTTVTATVTVSIPGTTVAEECSGRGLCDKTTGLCKCFRGYRLDDCSNQHALAFSAGGNL